jgi:hypothetical protein
MDTLMQNTRTPLPDGSMRASAVLPLVRRFQLEADAEEVTALFQFVFSVEVPVEACAWKYAPPWAERALGVVIQAGDEIIGFAGGVPLRGVLGGHPVPYVQFTDFMIHPRHRGRYDLVQGAISFFDEVYSTFPDAIFYGFTGRRALSLYRRFGLADLLGEAQDLIYRPSSAPRTVEADVAAWDWMAADVDAVWPKHRDDIKTGLIRDSHYLRWRYGSHPLYRYQLLGVYLRGEAVGWVVTGPPEAPEKLREEVRIIDLLLPEGLVREALDAVADALRASSLVLWRTASDTALFEVRDSGMYALHFRPYAPAVTDVLRKRLYYTLGDTDQW